MSNTAANMNITSIEKLEGISNWVNWKFAIKMLLTLDGLWECIAGTAADSTKDARALARISLSLQPNLYQIVRDATTSKEA